MGNLSGGFALLGLLGWMIFRDARPHANASYKVRRWVVAALVLLCIQIALGGLTSANFAATACYIRSGLSWLLVAGQRPDNSIRPVSPV